jgi:hypothetical protein
MGSRIGKMEISGSAAKSICLMTLSNIDIVLPPNTQPRNNYTAIDASQMITYDTRAATIASFILK